MAVAHNGSLTNGRVLRERLGRLGVVFQSESDSEVIGSLIARYFSLGMVGAIERAMEELEGAYSFVVMVDDTAGQLGRLFGDLGALAVNVEDFRLEHSPGAPFGLAEIAVAPSVLRDATAGLEKRGWKIASTTND